jgi:outer membrane murein-binding lipoprotein Lpp
MNPIGATERIARRVLPAVVVALVLAAGCSSTPESPWASPDVNELPTPVDTDLQGSDVDATTTDDSTDSGTTDTDSTARLIDDECFLDEVRCGVAAVPQTPGAADMVTLEYRVLADTGSETPVVHLDDGSGEELLTIEDLPDRPLVVLGSRGFAPGRPSLSCPELYRAETNADVEGLVAACTERLRRAGIDPAGTLPTQLGHDAGVTIAALGYDEVDLVVPRWRALSVATIADHVSVRRVVYVDPWLATDRAIGAAASTLVSIEAVWDRCAEVPSCTTPGTVDDFLAAISALDARPLDDTAEEPRPIDAARLIGAIVSNGGRASDLAYLPRIHAAILERDAETVGAFVQAAGSGSAEVDLLGITCSLFDPAHTAPASLPALLREDATDGIELFTNACTAWPAEDRTAQPAPLPGLSVLTRSSPTEGADHDAAIGAGPVIVEPTVGAPTARCVRRAAAAWFDRRDVDDSECSTPLAIGDRIQPAALTRGVYDTGDRIIELSVPDTWSDSGYGTWWRDADPLDMTNLDVYVWDAAEAETAREEIASEWGVIDPELSSTQYGEHIWLIAQGMGGLDTAIQIATSRIDDTTVAVILESTEAEATRLAGDVLVPALTALVVR